MGLGSAPHSDPLKESVTLPLGGVPTNMAVPVPVHRHDALPNAQGVLSIDGMDVSGYDRVPCFAMAGQDSDLFRGYSCSNSSYFTIILLLYHFIIIFLPPFFAFTSFCFFCFYISFIFMCFTHTPHCMTGLSLVDNVRYGTHTPLGAYTADSHEARVALGENCTVEVTTQQTQYSYYCCLTAYYFNIPFIHY